METVLTSRTPLSYLSSVAEPPICNRQVLGSNPRGSSNQFDAGRLVPSWSHNPLSGRDRNPGPQPIFEHTNEQGAAVIRGRRVASSVEAAPIKTVGNPEVRFGMAQTHPDSSSPQA